MAGLEIPIIERVQYRYQAALVITKCLSVIDSLYGLTTAKKSLLTADIPTTQRIWLAFAPLLDERQHRQVAGWYWAWQMLAITQKSEDGFCLWSTI